MTGVDFRKGEQVLYLDRATGQHLPAVVEAIDLTCDPPSYAVTIPSLGTTRETVASRLAHLSQDDAACSEACTEEPAAELPSIGAQEECAALPTTPAKPVPTASSAADDDSQPHTPPVQQPQPPNSPPPAPLKKPKRQRRRRRHRKQQQQQQEEGQEVELQPQKQEKQQRQPAARGRRRQHLAFEPAWESCPEDAMELDDAWDERQLYAWPVSHMPASSRRSSCRSYLPADHLRGYGLEPQLLSYLFSAY